MKKLLLVPFFALTFTAISPIVNAADVSTKICNSISVDDKKNLRSTLKRSKQKIRNVFDNVQCNGQNLLEFASNKNALEVGNLMISKLPRKKVKSLLGTIKSPELIAAAEKRVNG